MSKPVSVHFDSDPQRNLMSEMQYIECEKARCTLWCPGEKVCAIKLIAMQLIKVEEKK